MRIAIATAVYYPQINGVAVFSHNLAMGLVARGHEVMVLCPSQTGKNFTRTIDGVKTVYLRSIKARVYPDQIHSIPAKKKVLGVELPHVFYKNSFRVSAFPQREIKRALSKFCPDVVHVQVSDPIGLSVVGYAKKHHIPVVTTEHNQPEVLTDPIKLPGVMKKPVNAMLSAYFRNRQSKSDFVTMPTEQAIRNLLENHKFDVPIAAISNGVDLSNFKPGKAPVAIYNKYDLPIDRPIVLYVGRVDPEKKIGTIINAFSKALDSVPNAFLLIVGDGVDKLNLEKKVKELGIDDSVKFLGRVLPPDLYELYKVGSMFATASEIETLGIVLIEAAATGLPLIAVDKGAVSEVCLNNKNGFLCKPGDVDGIADAMKKILTDDELRKKFSQESIKISSEHDFEKTLDRFENIYRKVVKNVV